MELLCGDIKNKTAEINKRLQEFSIHIGIITLKPNFQKKITLESLYVKT